MGEPAILFHNNRAVIVDKPSGWLSVPSRLGLSESRPCVGLWLQKKLGCQVFPVHRLDECVSGLLLFALDRVSHRILNGWFASGMVKKTYEAFSELPASQVDELVGQTFMWETKLSRGKKRAFVDEIRGKPSVTHAEIKSQCGDFLFWNLRPHTGRSHQLRVELARHGFPIVGDVLYGAKSLWNEDGIALRHVHLDFSGGTDRVSLGLPEVFHSSSLASISAVLEF